MARFARRASKTSWLWQDVRAMHPKCPANRRRRIHRAKILPGRGTFRCTGPSNHARRANLAIRRRRTTLAPAASVPPNSASRPQSQHRPHGAAALGTCHPAQRQTALAPATPAPPELRSAKAQLGANRAVNAPAPRINGSARHCSGERVRGAARRRSAGRWPPTSTAARSAKPLAHPTRESPAAFGGASLCSIESAHPPYIFIRRSCGRVFQLMLQEQLRFPATQANVEARRALAMTYRTETACHQHLVDAESTAILEHNNARLKAAIPPEPRQHVHRFAVHAPHFAIFRPVVHVCILEQVFV